jgi:CDP-glycerol glycerophosphotransferase
MAWHPFKKAWYDVELDGGNAMNTLDELRKKYFYDARRYTYMLSPSAFCSEKLTSAFNLKNIHDSDVILEMGYPRNDFLFRYSEEDIKRVKNTLGLPQGKKVILYAPTWRDNQHETAVGYTYELKTDFELLRRELESEYVILFRAHYFIANSFNFEFFKGFVYNVSDYDDINELYIISDILVTDYSSVFFDYANLKRPMIFYMYDLEDYKNHLRDFYIDIKALPGEIVKTEHQLIDAIRRANSDFIYDGKYKDFNRKYNYLDGPDISERVIKKIVAI